MSRRGEEIGRPEWTQLRKGMLGDEATDVRSRVEQAGDHAYVRFSWGDEEEHGSDTSIWVGENATDIRIGQIELLVGVGHAVLLYGHPPYPIERWSVLWEGKFPK